MNVKERIPVLPPPLSSRQGMWSVVDSVRVLLPPSLLLEPGMPEDIMQQTGSRRPQWVQQNVEGIHRVNHQWELRSLRLHRLIVAVRGRVVISVKSSLPKNLSSAMRMDRVRIKWIWSPMGLSPAERR